MKRTLNEERQRHYEILNENFGMTWLNKIRIESSDDIKPEDRSKIAALMGNEYNGRIAVQFGENGEWYDSFGKLIDMDIDEYEQKIHNELFDNWGGHEKSIEARDKFRRARDYEGDFDKYANFDQWSQNAGPYKQLKDSI